MFVILLYLSSMQHLLLYDATEFNCYSSKCEIYYFLFKRLVLKTKIIIKTHTCGLLLVTSIDNMSYINHTVLKLITITGASKGL